MIRRLWQRDFIIMRSPCRNGTYPSASPWDFHNYKYFMNKKTFTAELLPGCMMPVTVVRNVAYINNDASIAVMFYIVINFEFCVLF